MKKTIFILAALVFSLAAFAQTTNPDAFVGNWLTGSKKAIVQVYKEGNKYNGKIIWLKTPTYEDGKPKVDKHNPDKANQTRPIMGLNLLNGFVFEGGKWVNGTIYDPEKGKTYSCKIGINATNDILDVRGFIGVSLLGRTEQWYKVQAKQ